MKDVNNYTIRQRIDLSQMLAEKGEKKHLKILEDFINNENLAGKNNFSSDESADLRAAAAYAILKINKNRK
jgi:hypothetical protein